MDYSKDYNNLPTSFFDGDEEEETDNAEENLGPDREENDSDGVVPEVQH